ncbi:MAG: DUF1294 domain-containing protein [Clostridia bacterium]|nr:DUF1294 domain-containing protein [Clostridia bacterium]
MMLIDKRTAEKIERTGKKLMRTPEKTLFITALLGGAIGIYAGMYTFRHKTLHMSFVIGIPLCFLANLVCIWALYTYVFY